MNKTRCAAVIFTVLLILCSFSVSAEGEGYSTESDPLVTLSYIEKIKAELKSELQKQFDDERAALEEEFNAKLSAADTSDVSYEVVSLTYGQKLLAVSACEIILRSGSAAVVVTDEKNIATGVGLSDASDGEELLNGVAFPRNHYIIIPRGDGRGTLVTSEIAYFMVRGEYQIVSQ